MNKPAFAALGVAGACAACCAVPLVLPLVGGLSVVALTGLGTSLFFAEYGWLLAAAVLGFGTAAGALAWRRSRRTPSACQSDPAALGAPRSGCACAGAGAQGGCP